MYKLVSVVVFVFVSFETLVPLPLPGMAMYMEGKVLLCKQFIYNIVGSFSTTISLFTLEYTHRLFSMRMKSPNSDLAPSFSAVSDFRQMTSTPHRSNVCVSSDGFSSISFCWSGFDPIRPKMTNGGVSFLSGAALLSLPSSFV